MEEQADVPEEDEPEDHSTADAVPGVAEGNDEDEDEGAAAEDDAPAVDVKGKGKESMADRMAKFKDLRARMVSTAPLGTLL